MQPALYEVFGLMVVEAMTCGLLVTKKIYTMCDTEFAHLESEADIRVLCADRRGAFVQPALYEAFGLTVVEAMTCGLVVFATNQGGPVEIVVDGVSGFHIDPYAVSMLHFLLIRLGGSKCD